MTTEFGAKHRAIAAPELACDGQLIVHRWAFGAAPSDISALAADVGRAHVPDAVRLAFLMARVRDAVPTSDNVRKGDFGEMIAVGIYSTRMGRTVPYTKLALRQTGRQRHRPRARHRLPHHHPGRGPGTGCG
ncbi:MAG TPA: hypothetical protein VF635_07440 [Propionibacteriaceae bacterium]